MLALPLLSAAGQGQPEAILGPGDVVQVSVYQNPDLSLELRLDAQGRIRYPLLGSVSLGGETLAAAEQKLAGLLQAGGYVRQPQVSVRGLQWLSRQVSVLGQVARPGRYTLEPGSERLTQVLAQAGGILPAGADRVSLLGQRAGQPLRRSWDVAACLPDWASPLCASNDPALDNLARAQAPSVGEAVGEPSGEPRLEPGDTLYVERAPVFYVLGEVQRPGAYRLERGMTVLQALAQAGGLSPRGTERGLTLHRQQPVPANPGGRAPSPQALDARLADRVQANDVIRVREAWF